MRERRATMITMVLELEDNCGALIARRKKTVTIKYKEGSRLEDASGTALVQQEFDKFVRSIPDELEV
jgi:hypothetical protein